MSDHFVLVPTDGLIHLFHAEKPLNIEATLEANGAEGTYTVLAVESDGQWIGNVHWYVSSTTPVNSRARRALAYLGDIHLIFTGPVLFSELTERKAGEIVTELSLRGG